MKIRLASFDDIPQIVEMGHRFYELSHHAALSEYDPGAAARSATHVIVHGYLFVAEAEGKVAGIIGMIVAPFMLNLSKLTATEVLWYVEPEARGAGIKLLRAATREARERGCSWCTMNTLASSPPDAAALLVHQGFRHIESAYILEL